MTKDALSLPKHKRNMQQSKRKDLIHYILKDLKNAQLLTGCISGTTACRDKIVISETRNVLFFEKHAAVGVILTLMV